MYNFPSLFSRLRCEFPLFKKWRCEGDDYTACRKRHYFCDVGPRGCFLKASNRSYCY